MVNLKAFSRLKNIFSRLNPIPSFKWDESDDEIIIPQSSKELLEKVIVKYPEFEKVILIAIYHLFNTSNEKDEYLTVFTKDNRLIVDLLIGDEKNVNIPNIVKVEGKKENVLVACHNHFLGAVIPSLDDIATMINIHCQFVAIVSSNHIGILINEVDEIDFKQFFKDFKCFSEYIGFCIDLVKGKELDKIDMMEISEIQREKMKSIIHDKFLS